jgi:hypothetical protein
VPSPTVVYVQDTVCAEVDSTPLTPHDGGAAVAELASAVDHSAISPAVVADSAVTFRDRRKRLTVRFIEPP